MLVVGLTGGIGSGKTTVAKLFANFGTPLIDADLIARHLTQPQQEAYLAILKHFPQNMTYPDGGLNRLKLGEVIFHDPKERQWLENLLHPLIIQEMQRQIAELSTPYCLAIIPLLLEKGPFDFIDRILVVDAVPDLQVRRTAERDKTSEAYVSSIINIQLSRQKRLARADDIIVNDGKMSDLLPQVEKLHQQYIKLGKRQ